MTWHHQVSLGGTEMISSAEYVMNWRVKGGGEELASCRRTGHNQRKSAPAKDDSVPDLLSLSTHSAKMAISVILSFNSSN